MSSIEPFVICGFGTIRAAVAACAIKKSGKGSDITIIEVNHQRARNARKLGYGVVEADATTSRGLRTGGAGVASEIVICIGDGQAPVAVRRARAIARDARIQVVLHRSDNENAVVEAGADAVVSISRLFGRMLAESVLKSISVVDRSGIGSEGRGLATRRN